MSMRDVAILRVSEDGHTFEWVQLGPVPKFTFVAAATYFHNAAMNMVCYPQDSDTGILWSEFTAREAQTR